MPTYYEILKVAPSASPAEIESALEERYNQVRRLVTHHDPNIVNQANQALAMLEQVRGTLTDSEKRAVYDAAIGVSGQAFGGLADPDALLASAAASASPLAGFVNAPPSVKAVEQAVPPPHVAQRTDAWICPKCRTANVIGAQFCAKCGAKIGHPCPSCSHMAELTNPFCPHCGADKEAAYVKNQTAEINDLQGKIEQTNHQIEVYQKAGNSWKGNGLKGEYKTAFGELTSEMKYGGGCLVTLLLFGMWGAGAYYFVYLPGIYEYAFEYFDIPSLLIMLAVFLVPIFIGNFFTHLGMHNARKRVSREKIEALEQQVEGIEKSIKKVQSRTYPE